MSLPQQLHDAIVADDATTVVQLLQQAQSSGERWPIAGALRTLVDLGRAGCLGALARTSGLSVDLRDDAGRTALMLAADVGKVALIDLLLEAGADVNAADRHGRTPLLYAAACQQFEAVKRLLDAGADAGVRDMEGHSAGDLATTVVFHQRTRDGGQRFGRAPVRTGTTPVAALLEQYRKSR